MKSFLSERTRFDSPTGIESSESPPLLKGLKNRSGDCSVSGKQGLPIECVREGDKIVRLKVTCACGEVIEIDCLYDVGVS